MNVSCARPAGPAAGGGDATGPEPVADLLDHPAAPEAGQAAGDAVVGRDLDEGLARPSLLGRRDDRGPGAALSAPVGALGVHGGGVGRIVDVLHLELADVGRRGGADLDPEGAVVAAVVVAPRDVGPRQARGDALDVDQRGPDAVQWRGDFKGLL
jgi:hypothetical protein